MVKINYTLHLAHVGQRSERRLLIRKGPFSHHFSLFTNKKLRGRTKQRAPITHQERAGSPPILTIYEQKINWTNYRMGLIIFYLL